MTELLSFASDIVLEVFAAILAVVAAMASAQLRKYLTAAEAAQIEAAMQSAQARLTEALKARADAEIKKRFAEGKSTDKSTAMAVATAVANELPDAFATLKGTQSRPDLIKSLANDVMAYFSVTPTSNSVSEAYEDFQSRFPELDRNPYDKRVDAQLAAAAERIANTPKTF